MKCQAPFFFAVLFLLMHGARVFPQQMFFNKVSPPHGKTFGGIAGIVQDKQGYMWFVTQHGLYRYDGYQMISYNYEPINPVNKKLISICADSSGSIWMGSFNTGLERFDPLDKTFKHYSHNAKDDISISHETVPIILQDHDGILWVGTHGGLDRFDSRTGNFIHYRHHANDSTSLSHNQVRTIYEDRQGTLWVGTGSPYPWEGGGPEVGGLNRFDRKTGKFTRYLHDRNDQHSLINNQVRAILEDSKGNFWVGTAGDGLHTMDRAKGTFERHLYEPSHPERLSRPPLNKQAIGEHIMFIKEDAAGGIWIGTTNAGMNYYDTKTKKITHYGSGKDTDDGLPDRGIWSAFTSREGVLWIGTANGNLYRIDPLHQNIPHYPSPGNSRVESFLEEAGTLWIGTEEGLFRKDLTTGIIKRFLHDTLNPASLCSNYIQYILKDREGKIWIATKGGLDLLNKDNQTFTHYQPDPKVSSSLSATGVNFIYEDPEAKLWIATEKGLNLMDRNTGKFRSYFIDPDNTVLGSNCITYVLKDRQGKFWVGSWFGLYLFNQQNGTFKEYLKGKSSYSICEDSRGNLWVGSVDGLHLYNRASDRFLHFTDSSSLAGITEVYNIAEDNQENLWLYSSAGLVKLNPERNKTSLYSKNYGVKGEEMEFSSCYKSPQGRLYFSDQSGYFALFPDQLSGNSKPPEIAFTDFYLADQLVKPGKEGPLMEPLSRAKEIRLHHDQNIFSFYFTAFHYSDPQSNHHLYKLENYDKEWRQSGSERRGYYLNVPPGRYVFKVKAATSNGVWAEKSINVIITPPWWSTWWFRIMAAFLVFAIFYGIIRWQMHQKFRVQLERSEKEKQLIEFQRQKGMLEMQALRAQMNPHFIFNCLSSINKFILKNESQSASDYLTKFSRLIRMVLNHSKQAFVTLEDELEMLRLYLEMERLRFQQSFDYNIVLKNEMDAECIFIPPLLLQPFAENAIWHGLMHKKGQGHLEIALSTENKILTCIITDNGIGRTKAGLLKSKSAEKQKPLGLQITAERLALLNQELGAQTIFDIEDIADDAGNAAGTRVVLRMHSRDLAETEI
ncbi:MAG: two-component regulator propeller domain-containing protein [Chitinophagaceae bacterium]